MPFAATPSASVAVHVMSWDEPATQLSAPFGDVTVTLGDERSTGTVAVAPIVEPSVAFEQSRRVSDVIVTVPLPPSCVEPTTSENSVPLVASEPQGVPSVTPSTVKLPPPLSRTWKDVLAPPAARNPPSLIAPEAVVSPLNWIVTEKPRIGVVPSRVIVTGTVAFASVVTTVPGETASTVASGSGATPGVASAACANDRAPANAIPASTEGRHNRESKGMSTTSNRGAGRGTRNEGRVRTRAGGLGGGGNGRRGASGAAGGVRASAFDSIPGSTG